MAAALVMSLTLPASAAQFPDMPTGWSKDAMQAAVDAGLFEGTEDGRINPTGELTRAELAKVIAKAFGATVEADLSAYTDVNGSWYTQPMALAVKMGVINGTGATSMSPTRKVTRQEAATILARALKLADGSAEDLAAFSDASEVGSWFVGPVAAMVKAGYLNGSDGKLNPTAIMTRESLAFMMYNIFTTYIQKSGEVTEVPEGNVMVSAPDVTLKGVNVTGDLIIGDGVGEGDVTIDNCTIGGGVIVRGGGVNSIHFISTTVTKTVIITKTTGAVRVVSDTESTVAATVAGGSDTVTLEGTFTTVEVATSEAAVEAKNVTAETVSVTAAEAQVTMTDSTVATVAVTAADTTVALANTTATTVTVAQAANLEMTGETKVTTMAVTSENVVVAADTTVVITTVQTDTTVVITGEPTIENPVEGSGEVVDTPPAVDPSPAPSESAEPTESGDPTDVGVSTTPAPHVHSLVYSYDNAGHWQTCTAAGHDAEDTEGFDGTTNEHADHNVVNGRCVCGYTETVTENPDSTASEHTHDFTDPATETHDSTCTAEGYEIYTCKVANCGATKKVTIAKAAHSYTVEVENTAVAATCTTAGKNADMKCANCTAVQTGATIPALNHTAAADAWSHNDTYHWQVCTRAVGEGTCGAQFNMAAHTLVDGVCDVCGFGAPEATDPPEETCSVAGCVCADHTNCNGDHSTCANCDACGKPCTNHTWNSGKTGVCDVCGATCSHATKDTTHTDVVKGSDCQTPGTWTVVVTCHDCGKQISSTPGQTGDDTTKGNHVDVKNNETDAAEADGKCDTCGETMPVS